MAHVKSAAKFMALGILLSFLIAPATYAIHQNGGALSYYPEFIASGI